MFSLPPEILANWLQPGALVAGAVGGMGLLIGAFRSLRGELKDEMRAGEDRMNKCIDEVKEEMRTGEDRVNKRIDEVKDEMKDFKEQVRDDMRAGEARTNKRIDEVKEEMKEVKVEMKEFKQEMGEIKTLLIQALRLPPPAQP